MKTVNKRSLQGILILTMFNQAGAHDGTVRISGTIQDNTCEISPDSNHKIVDMGTVASNQFTSVGDKTPAVAFSIDMEECGPAASEASVTFSGTVAPENNTLYRLDEDDNTASGLALGIYDSRNQQVIPNVASGGYDLLPNQSAVVMKFTARYEAVAATVTEGLARATITFWLIINNQE